jgi:lipid-A-disaccharide synthase
MVQQQSYKVFISAAESSGDKHAGKLIQRLRTLIPRVQCSGLGGAAMAQNGCKLLENLVDRSTMLAGALTQVWFYYRLKKAVRAHFLEERPDVVVVVDSPAWNFHVAGEAKKLGIPVLFYIAPQLWAWGGWRLKKLRRLADRVACILPFEEKWFSDRGVPVEYVGNPLFDDENHIPPLGLDSQPSSQFPTVALLPGSRQQEIANHWPVMQKVALAIREKHPRAKFLTAASSEKNLELLQRGLVWSKEQHGLRAHPTILDLEIRTNGIEATVRHADLAIVASGTATLEVAAQNCPMIILYSVPRPQWYLVGRWLIKTRYLSLVNILAGRELVPEFMPFFNGHTPNVIRTSLSLLDDSDQLQQMRLALRRMIEPIVQPGASEKTAQIVTQMLPKY